MTSPDELRHVYEGLAERFARRGEPRNRDHCLVLAADAALSAGRPDEAERLRLRLLQLNPHHLLRPYASMGEAMQSGDVRDYVADLRGQWPPAVVAKLAQDDDFAVERNAAPVAPAPPVAPPPAPVPSRALATPVPKKPVPVFLPPSQGRQTASPHAEVPRRPDPDSPTAVGRLLATLLFLLGVALTAGTFFLAFVWPFLH